MYSAVFYYTQFREHGASTPTNSFLSADSSIRYEEINRQKQNCRGTSQFYR